MATPTRSRLRRWLPVCFSVGSHVAFHAVASVRAAPHTSEPTPLTAFPTADRSPRPALPRVPPTHTRLVHTRLAPWRVTITRTSTPAITAAMSTISHQNRRNTDTVARRAARTTAELAWIQAFIVGPPLVCGSPTSTDCHTRAWMCSALRISVTWSWLFQAWVMVLALTSIQSCQFSRDFPTIVAEPAVIVDPAEASHDWRDATWPRWNMTMNDSGQAVADGQHVSLSARPSW